MRKLAKSLKSSKFTLTVELNPPKGTDLAALFRNADTHIASAQNSRQGHLHRYQQYL